MTNEQPNIEYLILEYGPQTTTSSGICDAEVMKCVAELAASRERERALREALEWYADEENHEDVMGGPAVYHDNGSRARAALADTPAP